MSTFPIEIVACRLADGTLRLLLLLHQLAKGHVAHGQREGVAYEDEVYRPILAKREGWRPRFYRDRAQVTSSASSATPESYASC